MHSTPYPEARFVEILDKAHNLPLHLAVELGIPAAVLICGGFLWLVITAKPWREREPFRRTAGFLAATQVNFAKLTLTPVTPANAERCVY